MKLKLPQRWCKIATLAGKARRMTPILCLAVSSLVPLSAVAQERITMSITPEDMETWIDISTPTNITFSGEYTGESGVSGQIEYSVDDPDFSNPSVLVNNVKPGEIFSAEAPIRFYSYQKDHSIYFRAVDYNGNAYGYSPIEIFDIGYVEFDQPAPKVYDGEEYCPEITANGFGKDWISVEYQNNINAGTAYANLNGVFPHTVGWTSVYYQITPAPLEGKIILTKTEYDFTGYDIWPEYTLEGPITDISEHNDSGWWSNDWYTELENNHYAGNDARMTIKGYRNYEGTITSEPFTINKVNWPEDWLGYWIPEADVTFDGEVHEAWAYDIDGMGEKIITYVNQDNVTSTEAPSVAGTYDVYLEYTEGPGIYAIPKRNIGQFSIYNLDEDDWKSLVALREELQKSNDNDDLWIWEYLDEGITGVPRLKEYRLLDLEKGQIKKLWLWGNNLKGELPLTAFSFKNLEEIYLSDNKLTGDVDILSSLSQTNPAALNTIRKIELYNNRLTGNAGVFAIFPNLEDLYIDNNQISDVYPMLRPELNFGYSNQTLDKTLTIDLRSQDVENLAKQIPTIALYNHSEQKYYTDNFRVELTDENDWNMTSYYENGQITGSSYGYDPISYNGKNGETVNLKITNASNSGSCELKGELFFSQGDVNFSASVDVLDVQTIILDILEARNTDYYYHWYQIPFNFTAANLFEDEVINVQDAVCLVNMLLESDPLPQQSPRKLPLNDNSVTEASVFAENGSLFISSEKEIAAFDIIVEASDIEIANIPGMAITKKSANGKTRIIGYSPAGITLAAGVNKIGNTAATKVSYAQLADNSAKEVTATLNNSTSGISSVSAGNANATLTDNGIEITLPEGSTAQWVISSASGMVIAQGAAASENGRIHVPFNAEKNVVYLLSVKYDNGTINKKLIRNN